MQDRYWKAPKRGIVVEERGLQGACSNFTSSLLVRTADEALQDVLRLQWHGIMLDYQSMTE